MHILVQNIQHHEDLIIDLLNNRDINLLIQNSEGDITGYGNFIIFCYFLVKVILNNRKVNSSLFSIYFFLQ